MSKIFTKYSPSSRCGATEYRATKLCQGSGKCQRVFKLNGEVVFGGIDLHRITDLDFLIFVSTDNSPFSSH